jgi:hypothetical protein
MSRREAGHDTRNPPNRLTQAAAHLPKQQEHQNVPEALRAAQSEIPGDYRSFITY